MNTRDRCDKKFFADMKFFHIKKESYEKNFF